MVSTCWGGKVPSVTDPPQNQKCLLGTKHLTIVLDYFVIKYFLVTLTYELDLHSQPS